MYIKTIPPEEHPVMDKEFFDVYREVFAFSNVPDSLHFRNVVINGNQYIHEIFTEDAYNRPHLVCLHGFGATSIAYLHMFEHLKDHFKIHALDHYGMGLSSRGNWDDSMTPDQTISYFV